MSSRKDDEHDARFQYYPHEPPGVFRRWVSRVRGFVDRVVRPAAPTPKPQYPATGSRYGAAPNRVTYEQSVNHRGGGVGDDGPTWAGERTVDPPSEKPLSSDPPPAPLPQPPPARVAQRVAEDPWTGFDVLLQSSVALAPFGDADERADVAETFDRSRQIAATPARKASSRLEFGSKSRARVQSVPDVTISVSDGIPRLVLVCNGSVFPIVSVTVGGELRPSHGDETRPTWQMKRTTEPVIPFVSYQFNFALPGEIGPDGEITVAPGNEKEFRLGVLEMRTPDDNVVTYFYDPANGHDGNYRPQLMGVAINGEPLERVCQPPGLVD